MFERSDCLLVDIGNSRLHWRLGQASGHLALDAVATGGPVAEVFPFDPADIRLVACARVGPMAVRDRLRDALPGCRWHDVDQLPTALLASRYDLDHLGKDRWLAALGACRMAPDVDLTAGMLVMDAGTAITLDLLTDQGHQGGWIMPGLRRWHQCLYEGTQIRRPMAEPAGAVPGLNTPAAIANGWLAAVSGTVQTVGAEYPGMVMMLTGGDAGILTEIWADTRPEPDLVLAGIETWLEYQEKNPCAG